MRPLDCFAALAIMVELTQQLLGIALLGTAKFVVRVQGPKGTLMSILTVSSKGQIVLPAALRRRLGMGAGAKIEAIEEADGLKLRVVRPMEKADISKLAGMVTAPSRGTPRRLEDFDPASMLRRVR
jgi:antitoxin PrlF